MFYVIFHLFIKKEKKHDYRRKRFSRFAALMYETAPNKKQLKVVQQNSYCSSLRRVPVGLDEVTCQIPGVKLCCIGM